LKNNFTDLNITIAWSECGFQYYREDGFEEYLILMMILSLMRNWSLDVILKHLAKYNTGLG